MITENSSIVTQFEQYLEEQSTVRPNQKPYYVKWVKTYLSSISSLKNLLRCFTKNIFYCSHNTLPRLISEL